MPDNLEEPASTECPSCNGAGTVADPKLRPCIWALSGPLNYISVFEIAKLIDSMRHDSATRQRHILDLHACKSVDLTGAEELLTGLHELRKDGVQATIMNVPGQFQAVLDAYKSMGEINAYAKSAPTAGVRPPHELAGSWVDPMAMDMPEGLEEEEEMGFDDDPEAPRRG